MVNSKLTPRQKMINMLYLVLTAILALNVSSEVLDAFKTVNDGINLTNRTQESKNTGIYTDLSRQYAIDSIRAKDAFLKAEKAKALTEKLNGLLEQYKQQMISEAGGIDKETGKIHRDDDINIPTRIFVENNGQKGKALKKEIEDTRNQLLGLLNERDRAQAESALALKIDNPKEGSWEFAKFNNVPVVAAVTLLSKFQNDVLSAEGHVVQQLYSSVNNGTTVVDQMAAKVFSPSGMIMQGEPYVADVMVAASNSTLVPDVYLGTFTTAVKKDAAGNYIPVISKSEALPLINPVKIDVKAGTGKLNLPGAGIGNRKYTGVVRQKNSETGNYEFYPFDGEYQVMQKMAVVSPTKMNVMYVGLDNPVDISVPGVAPADVIPTLEGPGTLVKNSDGSYKALMTAPGTAKIKVSAKVGGKTMLMGEQQFRVKRIPNPETTLDGILSSGNALGNVVAKRSGVVVRSPDFVYGDVQWKVVSFTAGIRHGIDYTPITVEGGAFNDKVKNWTKGLKKGDALFIDDIVVQGPDGKRKIPGIAFNITGS